MNNIIQLERELKDRDIFITEILKELKQSYELMEDLRINIDIIKAEFKIAMKSIEEIIQQ